MVFCHGHHHIPGIPQYIEKLSSHVKSHMIKNPTFYQPYYTIVWNMHAAYCFNQLILNVCWRTNLFSYLGNAPVYSPFSDVNMWMRLKLLPQFYWSDQLLNEAYGCLAWTLTPHQCRRLCGNLRCKFTLLYNDSLSFGWFFSRMDWRWVLFVLHTL